MQNLLMHALYVTLHTVIAFIHILITVPSSEADSTEALIATFHILIELTRSPILAGVGITGILVTQSITLYTSDHDTLPCNFRQPSLRGEKGTISCMHT